MEVRVTEAMSEELLRPFAEEEIHSALQQMHPLKLPGPHSFTKKQWNIIGYSVSACVLNILNTCSLNQLLNYTHIVLIPKCSNPENMTQFRPISLCNVIYKLVSKVLANRVKPLLDSLISTSQSAFIPNRLITDNVLVAYEINHFLSHKRHGQTGYASLKLDISKGGGESKTHWVAWQKLCRCKKEGGLGFRRLKDLNKALLAKQAWRVITNPNGILYQIFKYKYFPHSNFFTATDSHSPSYTWRSLMRTRELLAAGIRWSFGNGESISVVGVPCLPRPATFQVIFPPSSIPGTTKVAVLLDEGGWKESLVRKEFRPIDSECILSIPIPSERRQDELIWHSGRQGQFSVRSAYSLSCSLDP
ncbi:UNVERIFIED_CONTAM: putative ribonuclease H protein [Sesamum latifolium]|uniref:Ribonuclease H protein n=1 Tax=Sesamum latifolium TaxID=2727402 RepID=A0AAW2VY46_9LAMI